MGICSASVEVGDRVCVICGAMVPVVLRDLDDLKTEYSFLGQAYVSQYMYGRAIRDWDVGKRNFVEFRIL